MSGDKRESWLLWQANRDMKRILDDPSYLSAGQLYDKAILLKSQGCLEEAVAAFTEAIQAYPAFDSAYYNRGNTLEILGRYDEAIRDFERTAAIDPGHFRAICNHGLLLAKLGRTEEALIKLDTAAKLGDSKAVEIANAVRGKNR